MSHKMPDAKETALRFDKRTVERFAVSLTLSPHSVASYRKCLAYFFEYLAGRGIVRPDTAHVSAYLDELKASGRKANTVCGYMAAVKAFFRWTRAEGLYPDIASGVTVPRAGGAPNRGTLTAAQLRNVMDGIDRETLQGMRDYAILALMLTSGLSALEISRAKVCDVCESGDGYFLYVRSSDGQRHEAVSVASHAMDAISRYLSARADASHGAPPGGPAPLFISVSDRNRGRNEHMSVGSVSRIVKSALRNAGYDDTNLTAGSLKVSAMKLALQRGERLEDVQKFARHKQIRTTYLYGRHNPE